MNRPAPAFPTLRRLMSALLVVAMLALQAQWPAAAAQHSADWAAWLAGSDGRDGEAPAPAGKTAVQAQVDQSDPMDPPCWAEAAAPAAAWSQVPFAAEAPAASPGRLHRPPALATPERPPRA